MSSKQNRSPGQRRQKAAGAAKTAKAAKAAETAGTADTADTAETQRKTASDDDRAPVAPASQAPADRSRAADERTSPSRATADGAADEPAGPRPARLTGAAVIAVVEGALLAAYGVYLVVMGLVGDPDSPQQTEILAVVFFVLAALPLVAARGLWLRRSWSRGPAMITQIMALPVAWTLINSGGLLIAGGIGIAIAAITVLVLLVNPTATEALGIGPRDA